MKSKDIKKLIISTSIFTIGSIFSIWFLWQSVVLLTGVLLGLAVFELMIIGSKRLIVAYILIFTGGITTEIVAIYLGAWQYARPSALGVPLWLLPAWGNAGIISICIYKLLRDE